MEKKSVGKNKRDSGYPKLYFTFPLAEPAGGKQYYKVVGRLLVTGSSFPNHQSPVTSYLNNQIGTVTAF